MIRGRLFLLKVGMGDTVPGPETFQTVGSLRGTRLALNNGEFDGSTKDTIAGYAKLLPGMSLKTMTLEGDGLFDESNAAFARLRTVALSASPSLNVRLVQGDGNRFVGEFQVVTFEEDGPHDGAVSYKLSLRNVADVAFEAGS